MTTCISAAEVAAPDVIRHDTGHMLSGKINIERIISPASPANGEP